MSFRTMWRALAVLAVALLFGAAGRAGAKSYHAHSYAADIRVLDDGSFHVVEEVRFRFEGGPFHYVYRNIPLRRVDGIDSFMSPQEMTVRRRSSMLEVRWTFPETRDTTRTFVLSYRVRGAVFQRQGRAAIRWNAFPVEHTYDIDSSRVLVIFPPGWPAPERFTASPKDAAVTRTPEGFIVDAGRLRADRTVTIDATLPAGAGPAAPPEWQAKEDRWRRHLPATITAAVFLFLLILAILIRIWRTGIPPLPAGAYGGAAPPDVVAPPEPLPPAIAGAILNGRITPSAQVATVLDLAARGHVRFETTGKTGPFRAARRTLHRISPPEGATEWERIVFDRAFAKADPAGVIRLESAWKELARGSRQFLPALERDLLARGIFDPASKEPVKRLGWLSILSLGAAVLFTVYSALLRKDLGPAILPPVFALTIAAVIVAAASSGFPMLASGGRARQLVWRGFARHLKRTAGENAPVEPGRFNAWLAYAAAFGMADRWIKAGARWGLPVPEWFRGGQGSPVPLAAWAAVFSSGHGAPGAGGGGAAGGGSSGAG